jgi:hypothetical protein
MKESCKGHTKIDGSWWEYDRKGIPLKRVCDDCIKEKLSSFRAEVLSARQQDLCGLHSNYDYEDVVEERIDDDY